MAKKKTDVSIATSIPGLVASPDDLELVPVKRILKTYRLTEADIDHLVDDNSTAKWFGTATLSLVSFAVGLIFDWIIQGKLTDFASGALTIAIPFVLIFAGACGLKWFRLSRKGVDFKKSLGCQEVDVELPGE